MRNDLFNTGIEEVWSDQETIKELESALVDVRAEKTALEAKLKEAEKTIERLKIAANDELRRKDAQIKHLTEETTRLFDPTKKFWNEDMEKKLAEAQKGVRQAAEINRLLANGNDDLNQKLSIAIEALERIDRDCPVNPRLFTKEALEKIKG